MLEGGKLLARDGYDLAYAFEYHSDVMSRALALLASSQKAVLKQTMKAVLASSKRIIVGRPLRDCRRMDIAVDPWRSFASACEAIDSKSPQPLERGPSR